MSSLHEIRSATHARISMAAAQASYDNQSDQRLDDDHDAEQIADEASLVCTELQDGLALEAFIGSRFDYADYLAMCNAIAAEMVRNPRGEFTAAMEAVLKKHVDAEAAERHAARMEIKSDRV